MPIELDLLPKQTKRRDDDDSGHKFARPRVFRNNQSLPERQNTTSLSLFKHAVRYKTEAYYKRNLEAISLSRVKNQPTRLTSKEAGIGGGVVEQLPIRAPEK